MNEKKEEIIDTVESTEEIKLDESNSGEYTFDKEPEVKQEIPEFEYLAISKDDYEKFVAGIDILNDDMKRYFGALLHNKFKVVPMPKEVKE